MDKNEPNSLVGMSGKWRFMKLTPGANLTSAAFTTATLAL
jgi:hypothetical protein